MISSTWAAHGLERDAERLQGFGRDSLTFVNQPEQYVLGTDVVVVEEPRFLLSEDNDPAGSVGEALEQLENRLSVRLRPRRAGDHSIGRSSANFGARTRYRTSVCSQVIDSFAQEIIPESTPPDPQPYPLGVSLVDDVAVPPLAGGLGQGRGTPPGVGPRRRPLSPRRCRRSPAGRQVESASARCSPCAPDTRQHGTSDPARPEVVTGGASVELVHLGSLYHDDVIDEGRNAPRACLR